MKIVIYSFLLLSLISCILPGMNSERDLMVNDAILRIKNEQKLTDQQEKLIELLLSTEENELTDNEIKLCILRSQQSKVNSGNKKQKTAPCPDAQGLR